MDWQRRGYDPPSGPLDPGRWQVHVALEPSDQEVIQDAGTRVVPAEHFEIHTELVDGGDEDTVLALRVVAKSSEEAIEEAAGIYRRMRAEAGLPPVPVLVLGYLSPWWRQPRYRELAQEALALLKQKRHELAVVRVQTACELHIAEALTAMLLERQPDADVGRLIRRPATLRDGNSRALLHLLTGSRIEDSEWWPQYVDHLKRRNAIVHDGLAITREGAVASVEVSLELRGWLLDAGGAEPDDLDDLDEGE